MSTGLPDNVAHTGHITGQSADSAQLSWDVVVIGAGIAGLAAACELGIRRPSARVLVLEASDRVGGKLKRAEVAGVPVDVGAEAMLARSAPGRALMEFAGLDADLISPSTLSATVFAAGATGTLPAGTLMGIPGDVAGVRNSTLLDADAIAAVASESQLPPLAPLSEDVAVGALVRERFGAQVLDRLVEPLLAGVYAGRADDISLQAAVPALYERLSRSGGSLLAASADAIAAGRATYTGDPKAPVFVSVSGGIATFAQALVAKADFSVRTGTTVQEIGRGTDGFELVCRSGTSTQMLDAAQVIVAAPAGKAAAMVRPVSATAAAEFAAIPSASMAIITLAYRIADIQAGGGVRAGSGVLVAPSEGRVVKAVTISSQKWPGYPADLLLLRASVGRVDEVAALQRDDEDLIRLVRSDLVALLGITAAPVDTLVTRWGGGLPQYQVGHRSRIARIRSALADVGGIAACGASFDGVGIPACITSAHAAVTALEQRRTLQV